MTAIAPTPDPAAATPDNSVTPDTSALDPALPPPPGPPYASAISAFRVLNRWFMVPAMRAGLGAWLSTPIGGYILLLGVRGRKSGLLRQTPLNYIVAEGSAWVLAGFGPQTQWYRNLLEDPRAAVVLPGRSSACVAAEVRDPAARARIVPSLLRSTGGPALMAGVNPVTATDGQIIEALAWVPLVRLSPVDGALESGPDDPGGKAWIWRQGLVLGATLVILRGLWKVLR